MGRAFSGRVLRRGVGRCLALYGLAACASTSVPPIGAHDGRFVPEADERALWSESDRMERALAESELLYADPDVEAYLTGVAERLLAAGLGSADLRPRVRVLKDPFLNAFALPNGAVYVHTGLLARVQNEAQLASVLAHEIAHFTRRHALREKRQARSRAATGHVLLAVLAGMTGSSYGPASRPLFELGVPLAGLWVEASVTGYSRELESEADREGLRALLAAGYDGREALKVFELFQRELDLLGIEEPFFLGSHPRVAERKASFDRLLAERAAGAAAGRAGAEEFAAAVAGVLLENAAADLGLGRVHSARDAVERHLALRPTTPRAHFLMGEIHRRSGREPAPIESAIAAYRRAASLDPAYADPHRALGNLLRAQGRPADARREFARYLELAPRAVDRGIVEAYLAEGRAP
jgi:predicted Zn-dependent protease